MDLERILGKEIENTILPRLQAAERYQFSSLTERPELVDIINFLLRFGKGNYCDSMILS